MFLFRRSPLPIPDTPETDPAMLDVCLPSLSMIFNQSVWTIYKEKICINEMINCYTYALNKPEMGWSHPGRIRSVGNELLGEKHLTTRHIRGALLKDGLVEITEKEALSGEFHAIAARIATHKDSHFYRRDDNGTWSHKEGRRPIKRTQYNGDLITNPRKIEDEEYTKFGGYFAIPPEGILFTPRLELDSETRKKIRPAP